MSTDTEQSVAISEPSFLDDGTLADTERIAYAREHWLEAKAEDFEQVGKRRWRDRATGLRYRTLSGSPFVNVSNSADIAVWFRRHHELVFLVRADLS